MHYDITTLVVRPGATPKALGRLEPWLRETNLGGKLLACWFAELGPVNQVLLIREYEDAAAVATDRNAIARSANPFGVADLITGFACDLYGSFDFIPPMQPGTAGLIFEVRDYVLKPGGLAPTVELWRAAVPARAKLSPPLAALYSLSGGMSRFVHIWPYPSLDERLRIRAKAVETGVWPPPGGPDHILTQQVDIFLAAPFSPIR